MKRNIISLLSIAVFVALFVGCSTRIGDFTLISTKNVDIGSKYKNLGRFEGSDTKSMILEIPIGVPNLKQAVDNCIEAGKGELLTDAVLDFNYWSAILYGEQTYVAKGNVWTKAETADLINPNIELYELRSTPKGMELVSVSSPAKVVKVDYLSPWN